MAVLLFSVAMVITGAVCMMPGIDPAPTRAAGESIWITATVDFHGFTSYDVDIEMEIYSLNIEGELFNTTQMRAMYGSFPDNTTNMIINEINGRAMNLTSASFTGDEHVMVHGDLDAGSLDELLPGTDPITYNMLISGNVSLERFMSPAIMDRVDPGRVDVLISGMLLSGFESQRTVSLRADIGERVTYRIPDSIDPFGDGATGFYLDSSSEPIDGYYEITVDGESGEFLEYFTFTLKGDGVLEPVEERINGEMMLDWFRLDRVGIRGELVVNSMAITRADAFDDLPSSMRVPGFISPGFVRFADVEGLLLDEDVQKIEDEASSEMEQSLRDTIQGSSFTVSADLVLTTDGISKPADGEDLLYIISDADPLIIEVFTEEAMELDILEGYEHDDVMGLLNGGLKIRRELDQVTDDRLEVSMKLPDRLIMVGEEPIDKDGARSVYGYSGGFKEIGSELAEKYDGERIVLDAEIDLSNVDSHYLSDMVMNVDMDASILMHRIAVSPGDLDLETDLDYSIDHVSSDLLRLLLKMGIIEVEDVKQEIEEEILGLIEDLLDEERSDIQISISNESLGFDGNINEMDDGSPVIIDVRASGETEPLGNSGDGTNSLSNRFIPFHLDPLIPVRGIEKTIDTSTIEGWDTQMKVIFPSGFGVTAWAGENENDRVRELDVTNENGYPTLNIEPGDLSGDHILLELEVGPYFGYNNVTACFCSATGIVALLVLLILVLIIRGIVKKKRKAKEADIEDSGEEGDDHEEDEETMNW
ncbi:MAG: hypothetical protein ACMUHB_07425 [Thermoplasmatota archaeon]